MTNPSHPLKDGGSSIASFIEDVPTNILEPMLLARPQIVKLAAARSHNDDQENRSG
jgi:hypothetical protein